jgi:hypothetical protein
MSDEIKKHQGRGKNRAIGYGTIEVCARTGGRRRHCQDHNPKPLSVVLQW